MNNNLPYNLLSILPILTQDLIRIGRNEDGGYVLNKRIFKQTELLISFGISNEWSFEKQFYNLKKHDTFKVLAFDYSVGTLAFIRKSFECLHMAIFKKAGFMYVKFSLFHLKIAYQFFVFFHKRNIKFFQKGIDNSPNATFIDFETLFNSIEKVSTPNSVFIKMDIEGFEFKVLPQMLNWSEFILGFVVEFHELERLGAEFDKLINSIKEKGYIISHVHPNNWGGFVEQSHHPRFLEITFVKSSIFHSNEMNDINTHSYPIQGLDFPCIQTKPELELKFTSSKSVK